MVSSMKIVLLCLLTSASAASKRQSLPGCGDINIVFTGLPPYHPLVTSQGFDPAAVDAGLRADAADMLKAGYNTRVVLMGPEKDISVLADQLHGVRWDGAGIGYGVRGSHFQNLTIRLEEIIDLYRQEGRTSQIMFDHSFTSALWAV